jgi:hypothetical protein
MVPFEAFSISEAQSSIAFWSGCELEDLVLCGCARKTEHKSERGKAAQLHQARSLHDFIPPSCRIVDVKRFAEPIDPFNRRKSRL